jgi:undecaprenyl-diphosphatase
MTVLQSIILGIIQGITEFLPVSSSGHLVIVPYLFGWNIPAEEAFIFDILVQVASLVAVFAYFWADLRAILVEFLTQAINRTPFNSFESRLGWYIILATIPASLVGLALKDLFEQTFSNPVAAACFLLVTAGLLLIAERAGHRSRGFPQLTWLDALWIGIFQTLALFPGVSRSGSTITGGMLRNLDRPSAARFSFLMVVPVMLAAGLIATTDLLAIPNFSEYLSVYIWGFIASAVVGYLSIRWLIAYLGNHPLYVFSIYCTALAVLTLSIYAYRSLLG